MPHNSVTDRWEVTTTVHNSMTDEGEGTYMVDNNSGANIRKNGVLMI
jgi:hypothetical protein